MTLAFKASLFLVDHWNNRSIYVFIYFFSSTPHTSCISKCKGALVVQCKCMHPSVASNRRLTVCIIFSSVIGASRMCLIHCVRVFLISKTLYLKATILGVLSFCFLAGLQHVSNSGKSNIV